MRTTFRAREPYAGIFMQCAKEFVCNSPVRPERFMEKMRQNQGSIGVLSGYGPDEDGLERKNPVIVGLGDSVTAGHFEMLMTGETMQKNMELAMQGQIPAQDPADRPAVEITDARESYLEKFRLRLIDRYERTSVSVINAGIAGDHLRQMSARAGRDVIRYQPDLVLINGSLNWDTMLGSTQEYREILAELVRRIKTETTADLVLLTPNGDLPNRLFFGEDAPLPTTHERVETIRQVAKEEQVCLADVYAVWETAREKGCPWEELLANGINHPGVEGHEVYAEVLMKLFD